VAYARRLVEKLTSLKRQQLEAGNVVLWVNGAFRLAVDHAYKDLTPANGDPSDLVCEIPDRESHAKRCVRYDPPCVASRRSIGDITSMTPTTKGTSGSWTIN